MKSRVSTAAIIALYCLAVVGCAPATQPPSRTVETAQPFEAAEGEQISRTPMEPDDPGRAAFGVVKFDDLSTVSTLWSVRMYGIGGGDPAANGLKTYLAFVSPHDEQGFLLGDFRDYRVVQASAGRIDLEIDEDVIVSEGALKLTTRRVIVSWTEKTQESSPNPEYPAAVTLTPAR